jgi:hypothetical protein
MIGRSPPVRVRTTATSTIVLKLAIVPVLLHILTPLCARAPGMLVIRTEDVNAGDGTHAS